MKLIRKFYKQSTKPTKYFYIVILVIIVLFIIAYTHNNNISYIVMFFIFSISFFSLVLGRINITKAKIEISPTKVFVNTPIKLPIHIKHGVELEFNKIYTFKKRGYNTFNIKISSLYPLNLTVFSKLIKTNILVYPELKGKSLEKGFIKNENIDFDGLKSYNYDDIKFIHWVSFAKGELQVKKFSGDSKSENLIFDFHKLHGNKETKISQLALWSYEAFEKGLDFTIILDKKIDSKKGFDEIFTKLALY